MKLKNKAGIFHLPFTMTKALDSNDDLFIEGYANKNIVDSVGDRMEPTGVIFDRFAINPIIFYNHDTDVAVGKAVEWKVTDLGLWIKVKVSNSSAAIVQYVRDLIQEGIIKSFSIGFDPVDGFKGNDGEYVYNKYMLNEVSIVTLPCNMQSDFNVSKQYATLISQSKFKEAKEMLIKGIKKGQETDPAPSEDSTPSETTPPSENSEGAKASEAFNACVSEKLPLLIQEGKTESEAVAIAMEMCKEKGACQLEDIAQEDILKFIELAKACGTEDNSEDGKTAGEKPSPNLDEEVDKVNPAGTGGEGEPPKPPMVPTPSSASPEANNGDMLQAQVTLLGQMNASLKEIAERLQYLAINSPQASNEMPPESANPGASVNESSKSIDEDELKSYHHRIDAKLKSLGH